MLTSFLFLFLIRARSPNSRRSFRNLLSPFSLRIASSTSFKYRLPLFLDDDSNYFAINDGSVRGCDFHSDWQHGDEHPSRVSRENEFLSARRFPHRLYNFLQPRVFETLASSLSSPSFENLYFYVLLTSIFYF